MRRCLGLCLGGLVLGECCGSPALDLYSVAAGLGWILIFLPGYWMDTGYWILDTWWVIGELVFIISVQHKCRTLS